MRIRMAILLGVHLVLFLAVSTSAADKREMDTQRQRRRQGLRREKATLLALKQELKLPSAAALANWNESNGHVCGFTGVTCDWRREHVVGLALANMGISGVIPPAIGQLSHLRSLDVSNNSFSSVPASIGNLTRLRRLLMNNNLISGAIPPALGRLGQLESLSISNNNISGAVPPFGNLTLLQDLSMSNNIISGSIPLAICNLTSLYSLDMSGNNLVGRIPAELSKPPNLSVIYLGDNHLHGGIPPSLSDLTGLFYLSLQQNNLSGAIPPAIFLNCSKLGVVDLGNNCLSGEMPRATSVTLFDWFAVLSVYSNNLTGTLPRWIANCTYLLVLDVGSNSIQDKLPTSIVSGKLYLEYLDLSNNQFRSHDGYGNLQLEPFFLAVSNWSWEGTTMGGGELPCTLGSRHWPRLPHCKRNRLGLVLSDNALTGEIPPCIGNATSSLGELDLSGNMLSGSIPGSIGSLTQIRVLFLQRNRLSGEIPSASLGRCDSLMRLDLSSNLLTGTLTGVDADAS